MSWWSCGGPLRTLDSVSRSQLLLDRLLGGLAGVGGLDVFVNSDQGLLQGVEGWRIQHFLLDFGAKTKCRLEWVFNLSLHCESPVWAPGHQEEFLLLGRIRGSLALMLVFKIVQSVSEREKVSIPVSLRESGKSALSRFLYWWIDP